MLTRVTEPLKVIVSPGHIVSFGGTKTVVATYTMIIHCIADCGAIQHIQLYVYVKATLEDLTHQMPSVVLQ
jgi:hypothetical protein